MEDRIAKQRLNVFLLVDCSTSMRGERIAQVNNALRDMQAKLTAMQEENSNTEFYITVITFSTEAYLLGRKRQQSAETFTFNDIKAGGWSNLHLAYVELEKLLHKEKNGGIMPDFGGVAPIILLLTDGHPTKYPLTEEMKALRARPWFNVALKYGIAIDLHDTRTMDVLKDFVSGNGDVVECYDSRLLERIIKIIVLTASKVKSDVASVHYEDKLSIGAEIKQQVQQALNEVDDWDW